MKDGLALARIAISFSGGTAEDKQELADAMEWMDTMRRLGEVRVNGRTLGGTVRLDIEVRGPGAASEATPLQKITVEAALAPLRRQVRQEAVQFPAAER